MIDKYGDTRITIKPGRNPLLDAIRNEDRGVIQRCHAAGYGEREAVDVVGDHLFMIYHYRAALGQRQPTVEGKDARYWLNRANDLVRGMGHSPEHDAAILKDALAEGAASGGANVIATPLERGLERMIRDNTVVRPFARKIQMASATMTVPNESANVSVNLVSEGITIGDSIGSTAFAQQTLVAKKFAGLATVSTELFTDQAIGLNDYLLSAIAEGIGILEDRGALDGTNFTGVRVASGVNSMTCATTGTSGGQVPSYGELQQLVYLAQQMSSRVRGRFFMHPNAFRGIVSVLDTAGAPVFQYAAGQDGSINAAFGNWPVSLCSSISTSQVTFTSSSNIYFGAPESFLIGDRTGVLFTIDPFTLMHLAQVRVSVVKRTALLCPVGARWSFLKGVKS